MNTIDLESIREEAHRLHAIGEYKVAELLTEIRVMTHLLDRLHNNEPVQWRGKWINPQGSNTSQG
jgi:hypothetical protein